MTMYYPVNQPIQFSVETIDVTFDWPEETKRILVMGTSDVGPMNDLQLMRSVTGLEETFGTGILIQAASQALKQSEQAIWCYRTDWSNPENDFLHIQSIAFDLIVLAGLEVPRNDAIIQQFLSYCLDQMDAGKLVHGFVSVLRSQPIQEVSDWISSFSGNNQGQNAKHLSLVLEQFVDRHAAGVYAGTLIRQNTFSSLVNVPVPPSGFVQLTHQTLNSYKQAGIVAFRWRTKTLTVIAHAPCAIHEPNSTFRSITNVRMVQQILSDLTELIEGLISSTNPSWVIQLIEDQLHDYLLRLKTLLFLRNYRFKVFWVSNQQAIGIELDLTPIFALESIRMINKVTVRV